MKFTGNFLFKSFCIIGLAFLCSAQLAISQESGTVPRCNPTSCSCGGSLIAGSCSVRDCCKPNVANCVCNFYSSRCDCLPAGSGASLTGVLIPPIYEQNILEFANLLNTTAFSSIESKAIAQKLPLLISAARNNNSQLYFGTSEELENLSRRLPAAEKQLANNWVSSKGGSVFLE